MIIISEMIPKVIYICYFISAPPPSPENIRVLEVSNNGAEVAWDKPANHLYFSINGYFIEYWVFSSKTKKKTDVYKDVSVQLSGK